MDPARVIETVSCHAEGEVGDVIVGGVAPAAGRHALGAVAVDRTRRCAAQFRCSTSRAAACSGTSTCSCPPSIPTREVGFIIMEPVHTPPMSGSNSMCVATVVLETGIVAMHEPVTESDPRGPRRSGPCRGRCRNGKVESVITSPTSRRSSSELDAVIEVDGLGTLRVDTAFGGDSFVLVDAAISASTLTPAEAADLATIGVRITAAANEQLGFSHPGNEPASTGTTSRSARSPPRSRRPRRRV